jgi:glycoside/pentoside/hexuronide:cation symporter, GPH family
MGTKFALAASVGLALPTIAVLGFDPVTPDAAGIFALVVVYAWVPVVIKIMSIALVWGFPLTSTRQAVIRRWMDRARIRGALPVE